MTSSWKYIELSDPEIESTLRILMREAERTQHRDIRAAILGTRGVDFAAAEPAVAATPLSRQRRRAAERSARKAERQ